VHALFAKNKVQFARADCGQHHSFWSFCSVTSQTTIEGLYPLSRPSVLRLYRLHNAFGDTWQISTIQLGYLYGMKSRHTLWISAHRFQFSLELSSYSAMHVSNLK